MAGAGISADTARALATDPDLDKSLYQAGAAAKAIGVQSAQIPTQGKTFTEQTMTQQQRDAKIAADNAVANANRLKQQQGGAAARKLPVQTWSPDQ